jgi:NAD-dependent SIR2 family protein deacetylase
MHAYLSVAPGFLRPQNVLFVLGAGASYDHGYPLVGEFLNTKYLTWLCDQCAGMPAGLGDPASRVAEAEQFRKISENFEELLSTAFETSAFYKRVLDYAYWLLGTAWEIDHSRTFGTTAEYFGLATLMIDLSRSGQCSVITFNYDTAVEDALSSVSRILARRGTPNELLYFNYGYEKAVLSVFPERMIDFSGSGLPASYPNGRVPVIKLHGSVTTLACGKCGAVHYLPIDTLSPDRAELFVKPCKSCGESSLQLLMVPPGKRKKIPIALDQLWTKAQSELASSALVIIAGYSMPEYDVEARSMLQTALRNKDVLLVDPAPNASAIEFLRNTAKVNLSVIRETTAAFLRQELSACVPGLVDKIADGCAPIYMYREKMAGHPRA